MTSEEFYSITLGNFTRRSLGYVRKTWQTQREVIAAVVNQWSSDKVTGEDVFPFGITVEPKKVTESDREYMRIRHENTLKLQNG